MGYNVSIFVDNAWLVVANYADERVANIWAIMFQSQGYWTAVAAA